MLYDTDNIKNGCGSKGSFIKPPLAAFFKASCDLHDLSYILGGTEEDRIKADCGFLKAMLQDCERIESNIKRKYYITWAYLYFAAVRAFGWKYFDYTEDK